ncbi:MAG: hypothetical protein U0Q15_05060 [Kineosporiaceae bacterium]
MLFGQKDLYVMGVEDPPTSLGRVAIVVRRLSDGAVVRAIDSWKDDVDLTYHSRDGELFTEESSAERVVRTFLDPLTGKVLGRQVFSPSAQPPLMGDTWRLTSTRTPEGESFKLSRAGKPDVDVWSADLGGVRVQRVDRRRLALSSPQEVRIVDVLDGSVRRLPFGDGIDLVVGPSAVFSISPQSDKRVLITWVSDDSEAVHRVSSPRVPGGWVSLGSGIAGLTKSSVERAEPQDVQPISLSDGRLLPARATLTGVTETGDGRLIGRTPANDATLLVTESRSSVLIRSALTGPSGLVTVTRGHVLVSNSPNTAMKVLDLSGDRVWRTSWAPGGPQLNGLVLQASGDVILSTTGGPRNPRIRASWTGGSRLLPKGAAPYLWRGGQVMSRPSSSGVLLQDPRTGALLGTTRGYYAVDGTTVWVAGDAELGVVTVKGTPLGASQPRYTVTVPAPCELPALEAAGRWLQVFCSVGPYPSEHRLWVLDVTGALPPWSAPVPDDAWRWRTLSVVTGNTLVTTMPLTWTEERDDPASHHMLLTDLLTHQQRRVGPGVGVVDSVRGDLVYRDLSGRLFSYHIE